MIETATILLITGCIAAGVVSAVVTTWSLRALAYSLDTRLSIVEGNLTREVKARAGQERWKKPSRDEEVAAAILAQSKPQQTVNWWEGAVGKKGAYVP